MKMRIVLETEYVRKMVMELVLFAVNLFKVSSTDIIYLHKKTIISSLKLFIW